MRLNYKSIVGILVVLLLLQGTYVHATSSESYIQTLSNKIKKGDSCTVIDDKFKSLSLTDWNQVRNVSVSNVITFELRGDLPFYYQNKNFTCTLNISILYYTSRDQEKPTEINDVKLKVNYDTATGSHYALTDLYRFQNAFKVIVIVKSIVSPEWGDKLPDIFRIKNQISVERRYPLKQHVKVPLGIKYATLPVSSNGNLQQKASASAGDQNELVISWIPSYFSTSGGAPEEYDVEWTYIDKLSARGMQITSSYLVGGTALGAIPSAQMAAWMNNDNTRVTVSTTPYKINLAYPDGYILVRVRGVSFNTDNVRITSDWQYEDEYGNAAGYVIQTGHEQYLNWQYTAAFAEEGKKKEVISYFDGSLRSRQAVTVTNSDAAAIIAESVYDKMGRASLNILPTPTEDGNDKDGLLGISAKTLKYYGRFNLNNSSQPYSYSDISPTDGGGTCSITAGSLSTSSGASKYYSSNNWIVQNPGTTPNENYYFTRYVPDAAGYPFTLTEYTPDNTGRVRRQGGVGTAFQIGSGHETQYFYGKPMQKDLDRMFGVEAGSASHYLKNMVVDPNGQISVSYIDANGKTVATALAGSAPLNVDELPSGGEGTAKVRLNQQLIKSEDFTRDASNLLMQSSATFLATVTGPFHLTYSINPAALGSYSNVGGGSFCSNCYYDILVQVKNDCGTVLAESTSTPFTGTDIACHDPEYTVAPITLDIDVPKIGEYTVTYTLKLSKATIKQKEDYYIAHNSELRTLNDFFIDELNKVVLSGCYTECTTCIEKLGSATDFHTKMFAVLSQLATVKYAGQVFDINDTKIQTWIDTTYTKLLEECTAAQVDCPKSPCAIKLQALKNDVLPGGQYALYDGDTYEILAGEAAVSVFTNYKAKGTLPNYEFTDEDGHVRHIKDGSAATYGDVSMSTFIKAYLDHPEWADGFVKFHPEYCSYEWCMGAIETVDSVEAVGGGFSYTTTMHNYDIEDSYKFDEKIKSITKGSVAANPDNLTLPTNGYYKRSYLGLGTSDDIDALLDRDPFFGTTGYGSVTTNPLTGNLYRDDMHNDMNVMSDVLRMKIIDLAGTSAASTSSTVTVYAPHKNILKLVDWMLYCKPDDLTGASGNEIVETTAMYDSWVGCDPSTTCRAINREWELYRDYYLKLKAKYIRAAKKQIFDALGKECENCYIGTDGFGTSVTPDIVTCMASSSSAYPMSLCPHDSRYDDYQLKNRVFADYVNEDAYMDCIVSTKATFPPDPSGSPLGTGATNAINAQIAADLQMVKDKTIETFRQGMKESWKDRLRAVVAEENELDIQNGVAPGHERFTLLADVGSSINPTLATLVDRLGEVVETYIQNATDVKDIRVVSTLPSGMVTSFGDHSFQDVFHNVIESLPGYLIENGFNKELLDKPYPYDKTPFEVSPNISEITAAICTNITNIKSIYTSSGSALSFHNYLKEQLKDDYILSESQLAELETKCANNCKVLNDPMQIPVAFATPMYPNANHPFVNCRTISDLIDAFNHLYYNVVPNTKLYRVLLANYLNHNLGYALSYWEYDNFLTRCGESDAAVLYNKPASPLLETNDFACVTDALANVFEQAGQEYERYILIEREKFRNAYVSKCLSNTASANLDGDQYEYHYTLYYYDQSENLVKTIPPEGVKLLSGTEIDLVEDFRNDDPNPSCTAGNTSPYQVTNTTQQNTVLNAVSSDLADNSGKSIEMWLYESNGTDTRQVRFVTPDNKYMYQAAMQGQKLWVEIYTLDASSGYLDINLSNQAYANVASLPPLQPWSHLVVQSSGLLTGGDALKLFLDGKPLTVSTTGSFPPYPFSWEMTGTTSGGFTVPANSLAELKHLRMYKREATNAEIWANYKNSCMSPKDALDNWYAVTPSNPLSIWGRFNIPSAGGPTTIGGTTTEWANRFIVPDHTLPTTYAYNSLNQVVKQNTPDAGTTEFWYDRLGRLTISQNAEQREPVVEDKEYNIRNRYSYTKYDAIGRIVEVGEKLNPDNPDEILTRDDSWLQPWLTSASDRQVTVTAYDETPSWIPSGINQRNLRKRVAATAIIADGNNPVDRKAASYYTYDISGNVDVLVQENTELIDRENAFLPGDGLKRIKYDYDLISGKVNKVKYQDGKFDQFYYQYKYDADNRLTDVYTSRFDDADLGYWRKDAHYRYYLHGPLARLELGRVDEQVQGLDYAYTLQGWLKGVNGKFLGNEKDGITDMSYDGFKSTPISGDPFQNFARDAMAFSLGYYDQDYQAIDPSANAFSKHYAVPSLSPGSLETGKELFNGNISHSTYAIKNLDDNRTVGYTYRYDQLNRLTAMNRHSFLDNNGDDWHNGSIIEDYAERVAYDANGNIQTYSRNGTSSINTNMDRLAYHYNLDSKGRLANNKLRQVTDEVDASNYSNASNGTEDIDNQDNEDNYRYDAIGNLISDYAEHINRINWTVYGKINNIVKEGKEIKYSYDPSGNRITKAVIADKSKTTYYVRDAQGNVMGVYEYNKEEETFAWQEQDLYGSSRLGMLKPNVIIKDPLGEDTYDAIRTRFSDDEVENIGNRIYELTNHLGNVLVTITDKRIAIPDGGSGIDHYEADIVTANDYYPFGMAMPGRKFAAGGEYRYGFNGKENDKDISDGDQDYGMRIYDSRIGKFLSVDPLTKKYPWFTPYQFAGNKPIWCIDVDGLEDIPATGSPSSLVFSKERLIKEVKKDPFFLGPAARGETVILIQKYNVVPNNVATTDQQHWVQKSDVITLNKGEYGKPINYIILNAGVFNEEGYDVNGTTMTISSGRKTDPNSKDYIKEFLKSGNKINLEINVGFKTSRTELKDEKEAIEKLAPLANILNSSSDYKVAITGYSNLTDKVVEFGGQSITMENLLNGRAEALKKILTDKFKVDPNKINIAPGKSGDTKKNAAADATITAN